MSLSFVICICCIGLVVASTVPLLPENAELLFERFIQKYKRNYASEQDKQNRFQIFKDNLERAKRMNEKNKRDAFGITRFMDLTTEEFLRTYTGLNPETYAGAKCKVLTDSDIPDANAPESFDWRDQNVVTPVKNQLGCGSCYAFSAVGNIEGQYALKYKEQIQFSEKQAVDCDNYDKGCDGGTMVNVFRYIIDNGGLETETDYPYDGQKDNCTFDKSKVKVKLTDCVNYELSSQEKLKQLLYKTGPIAVALDASSFIIYNGDILLDEDCSDQINHGVLLVGYGITDDKDRIPYWIIKNSWSDDFGDEGYVKIERGENITSCAMMNDYIASSIIA